MIPGDVHLPQDPRNEAILLSSSAVLLAASLWAWLPSFGFNFQKSGFFMDDQMIRKNANVFEPIDWHRVFRTDYWGLEMFQEGTWTHKSFRPLTVLSFRFNYWLHTFDSCGFHVTNLCAHGIASLLLGAVGLSTMGLSKAESLLLAALFAAHPVHTESVLYIVGRADLLCCVLLFLAVLVYAPCAKGHCCGPVSASIRLLLASSFLVAAGLCKETGFCFFGLLAGWEIMRGLMGGASWRRFLRLLVLLIIGCGACYARMWYTSGTSIERMDPFSNPVPMENDRQTRLMTYALIHAMYVKLLAFPTFLCYDYSVDAVPLVRTLGDARLLLVCAAYQTLAQLLFASLRMLLPCFGPRDLKRSGPAESMRSAREGPILGKAILALSFLPMSNVFFPVGTVIGERLLYIPSAGFLAALVCLTRTRRSWLLRAALVAVGGCYAARCSQRVPEWENSITITVADGLRQERSTRAAFNLANERLGRQAYDEALVLYRRAIKYDGEDRDSLPFYHAGQILTFKGQHAEALRYLEKAVSGYYSPLTIKEEEIWHDYALSLWFNNKAAESIVNFERSLMMNPAFTKSWNNLACAAAIGALTQRLAREHLSTAVHAIEQAVTIERSSVLYWMNALTILQWMGEHQTAQNAWQQVQALSPGSQPSQDCAWEFYFR